MKFTHRLLTSEGWGVTSLTPSDFKEVKHLGRKRFYGDMFVAYNNEGEIHIFKGVLEDELSLEQRIKNLEDKIF